MRPALPVLVALVWSAAPVAGQQPVPSTDTTAVPTSRWQVGVAADVGQPIGAFKRNVSNAVGGQAHALLRLDRQGMVSLRLQAGWLNYGHESERSCLGSTPRCRVAVNVTTANGILSVGLGPQFSMPIGRVRTYGYGLVGVSRFATVSGIGGGLLPDVLAADENFGDGGLLWSGGIGLQLPVHRSTSVDIGVGYESHGNRNYLLEGGLTDLPDGSLGFDTRRSRADLYAIRIGVTTAIGRRTRHSAPVP